MKITSITKFKHGEIHSLLKELGWTQSELGRRCWLRPDVIGKIINLQYRPSKKLMLKIQKAFGEVGKFLDVEKAWPENFLGTQDKRAMKIEKELEIDPELFLQCQNDLLLEQQPDIEKNEILLNLGKAMNELTEKERKIIEMRFLENLNISETSRLLKISTTAVALHEAKALRRLRHPCRVESYAHYFK